MCRRLGVLLVWGSNVLVPFDQLVSSMGFMHQRGLSLNGLLQPSYIFVRKEWHVKLVIPESLNPFIVMDLCIYKDIWEKSHLTDGMHRDVASITFLLYFIQFKRDHPLLKDPLARYSPNYYKMLKNSMKKKNLRKVSLRIRSASAYRRRKPATSFLVCSTTGKILWHKTGQQNCCIFYSTQIRRLILHLIC